MTESAPLRAYSQEDVLSLLALSTTGELGSGPTSSALDLSNLTAHEIYSVVHHVRGAEMRVSQYYDYHQEPPALERRLVEYSSDLETIFEELQDHIEPDKIRDTFTMLASSAEREDKQFAGTYIAALTRVDHDYGVELWKKLLWDEDHEVAAHTWNVATSLYINSSLENVGRYLAEDGLTWGDFQDLHSTYIHRLEDFRERNTHPDGYAS
jgi:hypothetical protein